MGIRSLVLLSIVATAFSLAPAARADVPNPTTGSGGSKSSSASSGQGGASNGYDPNCTIAEEQIEGTTCQSCDPTTSACGNLGKDYNPVCQASATFAVYCNGPKRTTPSDQNVSCAVSVPGHATGLAAGGALAAFAALTALGMRRRRRS